jgi:hypothetical protein
MAARGAPFATSRGAAEAIITAHRTSRLRSRSYGLIESGAGDERAADRRQQGETYGLLGFTLPRDFRQPRFASQLAATPAAHATCAAARCATCAAARCATCAAARCATCAAARCATCVAARCATCAAARCATCAAACCATCAAARCATRTATRTAAGASCRRPDTAAGWVHARWFARAGHCAFERRRSRGCCTDLRHRCQRA